MKKYFTKLLAVCLVCAALLLLVPQRAEAAGISFSGSGSLRAGNSVTVTFSVSGSNILAIEANLNYDDSTLELMGTKRLIGGSWDMQQNGSKIILRDTALSSPINSSTSVFSATFRVKSSVSPGTTVSASVSGVSVSDGSSDIALGSASWSASILAPLSGDANLDDLWCDNAQLNFTGGTEYSITVPYSVSSLELDWSRSHSGSSVSVSGNSLSVGSNTVTVTVEAENGNTKRYYIYVTREQDPNYVPSTDAALSSLSLSTGTLSPAFSADVTDYVVYLPYEITALEISAEARDAKAKGVTQIRKVALPEEIVSAEDGAQDQDSALPEGETIPVEYRVLSADELLPDGETLYVVTCTAEDGTTKDYTVHVIRMPLYAGVLPEIIPPVTEPVEPEPEPEPTTYDISLPLVLTLPWIGEVTLQQAALGALIALGVVLLILLLIAWAIGRSGGKRRALRKLAEAESRPDAPQEALLTRLAAAQSESEEAAPAAEEAAPAEAASAEEKPIPAGEENGSAESAPVDTEPSPVEEEAPAEEMPEEAPVEEAPVEETVEEAPTEEQPVAAAAAILPESEAEGEAEEAADPESAPAEPSCDEQPAETEAEAGEDAAESEEAPEDTAPALPEEPADEVAAMSLDQLLEDIRNM